MAGAISFSVPGEPVTQGSLRSFVPRGKTYPITVHDNRRELIGWRESVALMAKRARGRRGLIAGPIAVSLVFRLPAPRDRPKVLKTERQILEWAYPIRKPDIDRLERAFLDACTKILWIDDAQVVAVEKRKVYAQAPGLDAVVKPLVLVREVLSVG